MDETKGQKGSEYRKLQRTYHSRGQHQQIAGRTAEAVIN